MFNYSLGTIIATGTSDRRLRFEAALEVDQAAVALAIDAAPHQDVGRTLREIFGDRLRGGIHRYDDDNVPGHQSPEDHHRNERSWANEARPSETDRLWG